MARQLAASRAQIRRQFEQHPLGILRCNHEGALLEANHALISALGYRTVDELRDLDFPATVFDSADDLHWLIQRCQNGPRQLADCILKKKDGSRLNMRLHAAPVSTDAIEVVAEDVTSLRAVEEQLREAHRLEAVGRLASEVADTCDNLLRNASRSGQELLTSLGGDTPLYHQGEAIFNDVTRAASFLRQLSAYGHKQSRAPSPVDVNRVLRDLEPVLKRVAGDDIELVLPKKASALNVDVEAERVERVLVNVAAYGRARMPSGGRLIVELARVAVDRNFVTKYPNVRQGGHALIRITEVRAAAGRTAWPIGLRDVLPAAASRATSERPGVDLVALQSLIGDCGGHLWMNAEPGGDMEVKIRLPLRPPDRSAQMARSSGKRAVSRWFAS
ncbi:MAG TPA: PAS domain S-box protein [Vicinamibacterales bacterium]